MIDRNEIRISVRNLVEFILRSGDIDLQFTGNSRAVEGTKAHQKIQKDNKDKGYIPEVTLKYQMEYKEFRFFIEGRADGIFNIDSAFVIDEIKTTTRPIESLEYNATHLAQAKCYAFFYCEENHLDSIKVQLTYYNIVTNQIRRFINDFTYIELKDFFYDLIDKYLIFASLTSNWVIKRNSSIKSFNFPFEKYRKGQREIAVLVYKTISKNHGAFIQAPTGIGKTVSTLFPAIKAMREGYTSKIFYLTAKTVIRGVAEETFLYMENQGLQFKTATLTAKDKICFKEKSHCHKDYCEYAKGHFDRVNTAIFNIFENENSFTREKIERYAKIHKVCPFEFSLDLTLLADCVICDYNYVFDPRVYLKRFFYDSTGEYTFLIDEAHNLADRAREMFSAELCKKELFDVKKILKNNAPILAKDLGKMNSFFLSMKKLCESENHYIMTQEPKDIYPLIRKFIGDAEEFLVKNQGDEFQEKVLEIYFKMLAFMRIAEFYDERYITYIENHYKDTKIKIFCIDPSYLLNEAIKRGKSAIFFSATLTPIDYFTKILGGGDLSYKMILPSPFESKNKTLLIADNISTKYKNRDKSYNIISKYIKSVIDIKMGNYIVFFPSYAYMEAVYNVFTKTYPDTNTIIQSINMSEEERENFLLKFKPNTKEKVLGFSVLGGVFSEGVDLKEDRLIGSIIVGVGLPQICLERNLIVDFFNNKYNMGYEYSYMYPGMNKVLQAAGRVIRTESDRGMLLLIDERFTDRNYLKLFPIDWFPNYVVKNVEDLKKHLNDFWYNA